MRIKRQISALLFILVANILSADITVNYTPSPYLYFERGNAPFSQNDFVAKLGTLVFFNNPEGAVIQDPLLLSYDGDLRFYFEGNMKKMEYKPQIFGSQAHGITSGVILTTKLAIY